MGMMFLGAFMLLVLPIFLFMSARMLRDGENGHKVWSVILQGILYLWTALCLVTVGILIHQMLSN